MIATLPGQTNVKPILNDQHCKRFILYTRAVDIGLRIISIILCVYIIQNKIKKKKKKNSCPDALAFSFSSPFSSSPAKRLT